MNKCTCGRSGFHESIDGVFYCDACAKQMDYQYFNWRKEV